MQVCNIELAGIQLEAAKDNNEYYIILKTVAQALNVESSILTRQTRESKSLEAMLGKDLDTTIKRKGRTQYKCLKVDTTKARQ